MGPSAAKSNDIDSIANRTGEAEWLHTTRWWVSLPLEVRKFVIPAEAGIQVTLFPQH
jgi:hypothetical protein